MGLTLENASYNRYLGDLLNLGGPDTHAETALRAEIGSLLEVAVRYTPTALDAKIRQRAAYRFNEKYAIRGAGDLKLTFNDGSRKGAAVAENVWMRSEGKFYIMRGAGRWPAKGSETKSRFSPNGAHWPDRIWAQYQSLLSSTPDAREHLKETWIAAAQKSRGLTKQSWVEIADALGIPLKNVSDDGFVRNAQASDGKTYRNGSGRREVAQGSVVYELQNVMPALLGNLDGEGILARAMSTREKALDIAMRVGVFADLEQMNRRYPGLLTLAA